MNSLPTEVASPVAHGAPSRSWRSAAEVVREAGKLYDAAGTRSVDEIERRVCGLVKEAGEGFARRGRWEQVFRLFIHLPVRIDPTDAELTGLRAIAQFQEFRRVARFRKRLQAILVVVLIYLLGVAPTLFVRLENPQRLKNAMSELDWSEGLYWSVMTLTTVGYGDIAPQTPYARMLSLFNALLGVTLMGVVAGLILSAVTPRRLT